MPMGQALRLCPDALVLPSDFGWYRELAGRFRAILDACSPVVEVVSIDEAYLDASNSERLFGSADALARSLKARVRAELGLAVSLGVATNKLVAKIASDLDKPDGLRIVPDGQEAATLAPLAVERLPGIGPKSSARLRANGIATLGELAAAPQALLRELAGNDADELRRRAHGEDERPVRAEREPARSLGHERTFESDRRGMAELQEPLYRLCEQTGAALRREGLAATTLTLKLRYGDFSTVTRQQTLVLSTDAHQELYALARVLLERCLRERAAPVRLLGVRASGLATAARQLGLFDDGGDRRRRLNAALDTISERAGARVVVPARFAGARKGSSPS
jgi:DNA polymerase-4